MRKLVFPAAILFCVMLLVFSEHALTAAKDALQLWWNSVLPVLLPFSIAIGMLENSLAKDAGITVFAANKTSYRLLCFFIGGIAGYPSGARLCGTYGLFDDAPFCNLCSPAFMLGVVCSGMCKNAALFLPMCIGHYASTLILWLITSLLPHQKDKAASLPPMQCTILPQKKRSFIAIVGDSINAMLRIGGCIVLFYEVIVLLDVTKILTLVSIPLSLLGITKDMTIALFTGMLEMTTGCSAIAALGFSSRTTVALCTAIVSFGGLCIALQTSMYLKIDRRYIVLKLLQAAISGIIAYLYATLFIDDALPAMYQINPIYTQNGLVGLTLLFSSCVTIAAIYILSKIIIGLGTKFRTHYQQD